MTDPYFTRRDIQNRQKERFGHFERWRDIIVGQVFSVGGSIDVPYKEDYVWIHEWGSDYSYAQALRGGTQVVEGMPVMVARDPKEPFHWRILGPYTGGLIPGVNYNIHRYDSAPHGENHQWPTEATKGSDAAQIWQPAFAPLKTEGNGSDLMVTVWGEVSYWYGGVPYIATGNRIDLTPYLPASGKTKYVLTYLDKTDGFVDIADGAEVAIGNTPVPPALPGDGIASALVQLTYGQTEVVTETDVIDTRDIYGDDAGGDVVGPGPTVTDDSIARMDGAGGYTIDDSGITISDANVMTFPDTELIRPVLRDYAMTVNTVASSGATETLDMEVANVNDITLDDNCTLTFINSPTSGAAGSFTLILRQDVGGTNVITWPASVDWEGGVAPTLTLTGSAVDILSFFTVDGGTTWFGFPAALDIK